jgi:hypothetical protein
MDQGVCSQKEGFAFPVSRFYISLNFEHGVSLELLERLELSELAAVF